MKKSKTNFDEKKFIQDVESGKIKGSYIPPETAPASERMKYNICREFVQYIRENGIKQRDFADFLGEDETVISRVVHYRVEDISLNKLVNWHEKIFPETTSIRTKIA